MESTNDQSAVFDRILEIVRKLINRIGPMDLSERAELSTLVHSLDRLNEVALTLEDKTLYVIGSLLELQDLTGKDIAALIAKIKRVDKLPYPSLLKDPSYAYIHERTNVRKAVERRIRGPLNSHDRRQNFEKMKGMDWGLTRSWFYALGPKPTKSLMKKFTLDKFRRLFSLYQFLYPEKVQQSITPYWNEMKSIILGVDREDVYLGKVFDPLDKSERLRFLRAQAMYLILSICPVLLPYESLILERLMQSPHVAAHIVSCKVHDSRSQNHFKNFLTVIFNSFFYIDHGCVKCALDPSLEPDPSVENMFFGLYTNEVHGYRPLFNNLMIFLREMSEENTQEAALALKVKWPLGAVAILFRGTNKSVSTPTKAKSISFSNWLRYSFGIDHRRKPNDGAPRSFYGDMITRELCFQVRDK